MSTAGVVPQVGTFGFGDLLPQLVVAAILGVVGCLAAYLLRWHLLKWLAIRWRSFVVGVLLPAVLSGGGAILLEAINWAVVFSTGPSPQDHRLLWLLAVDAGLVLTLLGATFVHADAAETDRKDLLALQEQALGAERVKVADARLMREFYLTVNEAFLRVVSIKRQRLVKSKSGDRLRALEPATQNQALIDACWEIIDGLINPQRTTHHRVRVAYFRVVGDRLDPHICYDGTSHDCLTSTINQPNVRKFFVLDDGKPGCLAVAASKSGTINWVPDAQVASNDAREAFTYFDEVSEKEELKSIVALPIAIQEDGQPFDVVTIDTDLAGYFHGGDPVQREQFKFIQKNLAHRLQLEKSLETSFEGAVANG
jgi:hypothetical protein